MKLFWTIEALNKLIKIEEFIAEDSPAITIKFTDQIIRKPESLQNHPQKGRIVLEFSIPELREMSKKKRVICLM